MNGSSWWDAVHGATGGGWLDVGAGSAITQASVTAGMHHPHHPHHQMSNYNDYSTLTHTLAASNPHILTSGQHLLQVGSSSSYIKINALPETPGCNPVFFLFWLDRTFQTLKTVF